MFKVLSFFLFLLVFLLAYVRFLLSNEGFVDSDTVEVDFSDLDEYKQMVVKPDTSSNGKQSALASQTKAQMDNLTNIKGVISSYCASEDPQYILPASLYADSQFSYCSKKNFRYQKLGPGGWYRVEVPDRNVKSVSFLIVGGGGGGGTGGWGPDHTNGSGGGGGGAGAVIFVDKWPLPDMDNLAISVYVGAGGTGGIYPFMDAPGGRDTWVSINGTYFVARGGGGGTHGIPPKWGWDGHWEMSTRYEHGRPEEYLNWGKGGNGGSAEFPSTNREKIKILLANGDGRGADSEKAGSWYTGEGAGATAGGNGGPLGLRTMDNEFERFQMLGKQGTPFQSRYYVGTNGTPGWVDSQNQNYNNYGRGYGIGGGGGGGSKTDQYSGDYGANGGQGVAMLQFH